MIECILRQRGLTLSQKSISSPRAGQECGVYRALDNEGLPYILRRPRSRGIAFLLKRELEFLQKSNLGKSFSLPHPIELGASTLHRELPGSPAITVTPDGKPHWNIEGDSPLFLDSLAVALAEIHGSKHSADTHQPLPYLSPKNTTPLEQFLDMLACVAAKNLFSPAQLGIWKKWADSTSWPENAVPTHGDLHAGNIIINEEGTVTGLIDWTQANVSDPSYDFIFHYLGFGKDGLQLLLDSYEKQGGKVFPGMLEHIMGLWETYPMRHAFFRLIRKDDDLLRQSRKKPSS